MAFDLNMLVRENIKRLVPYSSARDERGGGRDAQIFLDANENSFGSPIPIDYSRYPDPQQTQIKKQLAELNGLKPSQIFVGNGSDEAIDLLFRIFCRPETDNVIVCPPTYGMYEVAAGINDISVRRANLTADFQLDLDAVKSAISENTKLIFLCSPNNPTGNCLDRESILDVVRTFAGIVVIDEAYIHFCAERTLVQELESSPNLVILQTFSKAWGLAGLRVGLAFASEQIIDLVNRVKAPYNVSQTSQELVLQALACKRQVEENISHIVSERKRLTEGLVKLPLITKVYPSESNFVLARTAHASDIYRFLLDKGIVVRNRTNIALCEGCLRITVGTPDENRALLGALEKYEESFVY